MARRVASLDLERKKIESLIRIDEKVGRSLESDLVTHILPSSFFSKLPPPSISAQFLMKVAMIDDTSSGILSIGDIEFFVPSLDWF